MAKNWKLGEAVRAIQAGNKEDIIDLGRRFPLFSNLAAQVNEAGMAIIDCVPDYCTARKIESVLKGDVQEAAEVDDEGAEEEAPAKKAPEKAEKKAPAKKAAKKAEEEDDSLESKSAKELFDMCKEAGLKVKPKQEKSVYIEALKAAKEDAEEEEEEGWEDEDEEEAPKKAPAKVKAKPAAKKAQKKDEDDDDWEV